MHKLQGTHTPLPYNNWTPLYKMFTNHARHPSTQAYHLGMYGADYAWILHHDAVAGRPWWWQWWRLRTADCAAAQVAAAAENVLIVASHNRMVDDGGDAAAVRSLSGLVMWAVWGWLFVCFNSSVGGCFS